MQLKNTETTGGSRVLKEYGKKTSLGQSIKKKIQKICYSHTHTKKKISKAFSYFYHETNICKTFYSRTKAEISNILLYFMDRIKKTFFNIYLKTGILKIFFIRIIKRNKKLIGDQ